MYSKQLHALQVYQQQQEAAAAHLVATLPHVFHLIRLVLSKSH
jgi:hypothetical protein